MGSAALPDAVMRCISCRRLIVGPAVAISGGPKVNFKRSGALLGVVAVGAMTLAACGSDNNASSSGVDTSASTATCEGKEKISAAGSSAQKNAMDQFVEIGRAHV